MEYKVVSDEDLRFVVKVVNEMLKQGWMCQGGVSVSMYRTDKFYSEKRLFCQAMIKN